MLLLTVCGLGMYGCQWNLLLLNGDGLGMTDFLLYCLTGAGGVGSRGVLWGWLCACWYCLLNWLLIGFCSSDAVAGVYLGWSWKQFVDWSWRCKW